LPRLLQLPEGSGLDGIESGTHYPVVWIDCFPPHGMRQHAAFVARSRVEVDVFQAAAIKAGGADNGPAGLRSALSGASSGYPCGCHAAFVIDPDGNEIEAVFREG